MTVATPAQQNFIASLASKRDLTTDLAALVADAAALPKWKASKLIDALKAAPVAAAPAPVAGAVVAPGRYAVALDGKLGFYKVDAPQDGRWAGFTFVKQQAGDDHYPVKGGRKGAVLAAIAADAKAAMLAYGRELGKCGHCGRTLTDEASRAAGIGPICRQRMGW
jgi:hypothetical protein